MIEESIAAPVVRFERRASNGEETKAEHPKMHRIFIPSAGPSDWRRLLADPASQWVRKKSALEVAVAWEAARQSARGLPPQVAETLDLHDYTRGAQLLLAFPEHRVALPGGGHASQADLWALLRSPGGLISLAVEAKSGESLGEPVETWLAKASPASGKPTRLAFLRDRLGLAGRDVARIRYQLLHRTVSAIVEAERFGATLAVLLVQSFGGASDDSSRADLRAFARLLSADESEERLCEARVPGTVRLLVGWTTSPCATEREFASAV